MRESHRIEVDSGREIIVFEDGSKTAVWHCSGCGSENSEDNDPIRCSCCWHCHPYLEG